MKSLNMYLGSVIDNDDVHFESLLDDDDIFLDPENDKKVIEEWIESNYIIRGKLTISDDLIVNCNGEVRIKNKNIESLTNGLFRWSYVDKSFYCNGCKNIKTLEGAPEWVGMDFSCDGCGNLTSLEGAPKWVGGEFDCSYCDSLKSLEGCPKKIGKGLYCRNCKNLKITDSDRKKYKIED